MILCLEGASAVGKTTTCRALEARLKAAVVPEVNALFERPHSAPDDWYLERQVDRYTRACQALETHPLAVLDGDPFQPLWYNWSFGFKDCQSLDHLRGFFRPLVASGTLSLPARYFLLVTDEGELRRRREADQTRSRRNFERHLCLVETQRRYFSAMATLAPHLVEVIAADSVQGNLAYIQEGINSAPATVDALKLFDALVGWLKDNEA
jgi:hypothetical protein